MIFILDTNICIYLMKNSSERVLGYLKKYEKHRICLSAITLSELFYSVFNSKKVEQNENALLQFVSSFEVLDFSSHVCLSYGKVRAGLRKKGSPVGAMDLLIASHAISLDATLVTNDEKDFKTIPGLKMASWTK